MQPRVRPLACHLAGRSVQQWTPLPRRHLLPAKPYTREQIEDGQKDGKEVVVDRRTTFPDFVNQESQNRRFYDHQVQVDDECDAAVIVNVGHPNPDGSN